MNKDEIKKGLELCSNNADCEECPYRNKYCCTQTLQRNSLNLITEQEEEIKQLKAECEYRKKQYDTQLAENTRLHIEYDKAFKRLKAQQQEINALQEENDILHECVDYLKDENKKHLTCDFVKTVRKQAKIDVLNELKGRLGQVKIDDTKIKFWKVTDMSGTLEQAPIDYKPVNIIIDELIKEYEDDTL